MPKSREKGELELFQGSVKKFGKWKQRIHRESGDDSWLHIYGMSGAGGTFKDREHFNLRYRGHREGKMSRRFRNRGVS